MLINNVKVKSPDLPNLFLQEYSLVLSSSRGQRRPSLFPMNALPTLLLFMFWPGPAMMFTIELSFRLLLLENCTLKNLIRSEDLSLVVIVIIIVVVVILVGGVDDVDDELDRQDDAGHHPEDPNVGPSITPAEVVSS